MQGALFVLALSFYLMRTTNDWWENVFFYAVVFCATPKVTGRPETREARGSCGRQLETSTGLRKKANTGGQKDALWNEVGKSTKAEAGPEIATPEPEEGHLAR